MSDFEWQIEDDTRRPKPLPATHPPTARRYRRLGIALGVPALIGLALLVLQVRASQLTEDAVNEARKDILASHQLVERTASRSDRDLFVTLLPRDDPLWSREQRELFDRGLIFRREPLGLVAQTGSMNIVSTTLSPDLHTATIVFDQAYTTLIEGGAAQTIDLRHTAYYRFDGERWLFAAPEPDEWGDPITATGKILTLVYPARDQEIAGRLGRDLDATLSDLCAEMRDLGCPAGRRLLVRLVTRSNSLVDLTQTGDLPVFGRDDTLRFSLPTPSLVGLPLDEAGYQALYRRYGQHIARNLAFNPRVFDRSGATGTFYRAVLDRLLIQHGLLQWPMGPAGDLTPPDSIPLPDQDIALYCIEGPVQGGTLYRYNPATDIWSEELSGRIIMSMAALPSGDSLMLHEQAGLNSETPSRLVLWRDGQEITLFAAPEGGASASYAGRIDPSGRKLVVNLKIGPNVFTPALIDLDRCSAAGCHWTTLTGYPRWSPDGQHTLIEGSNSLRISLGDSRGQPIKLVGVGVDPFWLDDNTFGYTQRNRFGIVLASISGEPARIVTAESEAVASLLGDDPDNPTAQVVAQVFAVDSGRVLQQFRANMPGRGSATYTFLSDAHSGAFTSLALERAIHSASFSPDGHWLAIEFGDASNMRLTLELIDLRQDGAQSFTFNRSRPPQASDAGKLEWSRDGQWLFVLDDGVLHLVAPGYGYQRAVVPDSLDGQWLFMLDDGALRLVTPGYGYQRAVVPDSPGCVYADWIDR